MSLSKLILVLALVMLSVNAAEGHTAKTPKSKTSPKKESKDEGGSEEGDKKKKKKNNKMKVGGLYEMEKVARIKSNTGKKPVSKSPQ